MNALAELPVLVDAHGEPLRLGRKLGQGGEGAVFEVKGDPRSVAKIYLQPMTRERVEKVRILMAMRNATLDGFAAWPTELLSLRSGIAAGIRLPRLAGYKDIHQLYSPKSRRLEFRHADWRFLVRVAVNLSRAFATIHETAGVVVADVNHGGVLVGQDASVRLIDCDSFQVSDGARLFPCDVGVPTFTPPELQGLGFTGLRRTANHDNFGLAVLVFLLLFMGRHPFAGRYRGAGEMPIELAIRQHRFAYGSGAAAALMERPPGTPPLHIVSPRVAALFERAFGREGVAGGRPSAREWVVALDGVEGELQPCAASAVHWHAPGLSECPWCAMEAATGVPLFSRSVSPGVVRRFDADAFWQQVTAVESPGPAPMIERDDTQKGMRPSEHVAALQRRARWHVPIALLVASLPLWIGVLIDLPALGKLFFFVSAVLLYVLIRRVLRAPRDILAFLERERLAREAWEDLRREWSVKAGSQLFDAKRAELERLRAEWALLSERQVGEVRARQLAGFLDRFEIADAAIRGIGPGRQALLESFGIGTAGDVADEMLRGIPGFGATLQAALIDWRRSLEAGFRIDASEAVDPAPDVLAAQVRIESALRRGLAELQQLRTQILFARSSLRHRAEQAYVEYLQGVVDLEAVRK